MMPCDSTGGLDLTGLDQPVPAADLITGVTSIDGTASYSYDPTGQLTGATYTGGQSDEYYSYDPNGNRTSATGSASVIGANNELLSDGTYTYSYDAEGNRTERVSIATGAVTDYTWDNRNRLVEVTDRASAGGPATQVVDYLYDAENRWIGETVTTIAADGSASIHASEFAYDGNQIVLEFEKDSPAGAGATGSASALSVANLSHRYLWNPAAVDTLLADEQLSPLPAAGGGQGEGFDLSAPGNVVLPLTDNLGTPRDLAVYNAQTSITTVANHRVFDSYGNLKSQTNAAVDCLFGFTGFAFDKASRLNMSRTRPDDPSTGGWISQDWSRFNGRDTNLGRYCGNSPTIITDPRGLDGAAGPADPGFWSGVGASAAAALDGIEAGVAWALSTAESAASAAAASAAASIATAAAVVLTPSLAGPLDEEAWFYSEESASEKTARDMGRQIDRDLGKDAGREFHDAKERGAGDRTLQQLKDDAKAIYEKYGKRPPEWMQ
jgi:RHS repeat-associated protein